MGSNGPPWLLYSVSPSHSSPSGFLHCELKLYQVCQGKPFRDTWLLFSACTIWLLSSWFLICELHCAILCYSVNDSFFELLSCFFLPTFFPTLLLGYSWQISLKDAFLIQGNTSWNRCSSRHIVPPDTKDCLNQSQVWNILYTRGIYKRMHMSREPVRSCTEELETNIRLSLFITFFW